jgi:cysteine protease ATG4
MSFTNDHIADDDDMYLISKGDALSTTILGAAVQDATERSQALSRIIWCTYRANIAAFGPTGIRTDAGWGCMLRAAQMVLANALVRHFGDLLHRRVLTWFDDSLDDASRAPFAVQQVARAGLLYGTPIGHWFGPQVACSAVRDLVSRHGDLTGDFAVYVARDGVIYRDELDAAVAASPQTGCLILVPQRLGLDVINTAYVAQVRRALKSPYSLGIAGGRSNGARYFCGVAHNDSSDDYVLFLDPHVVQMSFSIADNAELFDESSFHAQGAASMPLHNIDPSLAFAFYCRDAAERSALLASIGATICGDQVEFQALSVVDKLPNYLRSDNAQAERSQPILVSFEAGGNEEESAAKQSDDDAHDDDVDEFALL